MWKEIECENCSGSGETICNRCGGTGSLPGFATFGGGFTSCDVCIGSGYVPCLKCDGNGSNEEWADNEETDEEEDGYDTKYDLYNFSNDDKYSYVLQYAENGNILAQYDLGMMYLNKEVNLNEIPASENLATDSFEEYCSNQNINFNEEDDDDYYSYYEADKYESLSQKWLRKAAKLGHIKAQLSLIKFYTDGYSYDTAKKALDHAIQEGGFTENIVEIARNTLHNKAIGVPFKYLDNTEEYFKNGENLLSNFIQKSDRLSSNFETWKDLILMFKTHLSYTPRKKIKHDSNIKVSDNYKQSVSNKQKTNKESYTFTLLKQISTNQEFDAKSILLEYLKVKSSVDEHKNPIVSTVKESNEVKYKERYQAIKLLDEVVFKFRRPVYLENRKLSLLFDDLKVLSMILRIGIHQRWILEDELFDITYKIWSKLFFSSENYNDGFINYRLKNENANIEKLISADFSASMLAWIYIIETSNSPQYIQFLWSILSVYNSNNWIFHGGDKEKINKELNKTLLAIYEYTDMKNLLEAHGNFWKLILQTGNAFQNLILKLSSYKVSDFKDDIGEYYVQENELLWQGKDTFYIVPHQYLHSDELNVDVISINPHKPDKVFKSQFTIPLKRLLEINNTLIIEENKEAIIDFINYGISISDNNIAMVDDKELTLDEIKDLKAKSFLIEIDSLKIQSQQDTETIQKLYEEMAEQGDSFAKYNMGNRYMTGNEVTQNYQLAAKWYIKAEEQAYRDTKHLSYSMRLNMKGNYKIAMGRFKEISELVLVAAKKNIEVMYNEGDSISIDIADTWCQESKIQESREALDLLEEMNFSRINFTKKYDLEYLEEEKEDLDAQTQYILGWHYYHGYEVYQDYEIAAEWYQKSAEQGVARAQYNLGNMYISGKGVVQNEEKAIKWLKLAAEQKYGEALDTLGKLYLKNDKELGEKWLKKAADQREAEAQYALGILLFIKDDKTAKEWLEKSSEQKYNPALYALGVLYQGSEAMRYLKRAAEQGYNNAQYVLGMLHCSNKIGVEENTYIALRWLIKAAKQGHAEAQFRLGSVYMNAYGAILWYEQAARRGYVHAQYLWAVMHDNGIGVLEDYLTAKEWYKKAAEQEHVEAEYLTATFANEEHEKGEWLKKAAREGHMEAQFALYSMFHLNLDEMANFWGKKAAEQGHIEAQYRLASMYYSGEGIEQDYSVAIYWYTKAIERDNTDAYDSLKYLYNKHRNRDHEEVKKLYKAIENDNLATANYSLGNMAENGLGMEIDRGKALDYYKKAMDLGHKEATFSYSKLNKYS